MSCKNNSAMLLYVNIWDIYMVEFTVSWSQYSLHWVDHICKILAYTKKGRELWFHLYLLNHNYKKEFIFSESVVMYSCVLGCECSFAGSFLHRLVNPGGNFCLGVHCIFLKQLENWNCHLTNSRKEEWLLYFSSLALYVCNLFLLSYLKNVFKSKV